MNVDENIYFHAFALTQYIKDNYGLNKTRLDEWIDDLSNIFFPGIQKIYTAQRAITGPSFSVNLHNVIKQVITMLDDSYNFQNLQTIAGMFLHPVMSPNITGVTQVPFLQSKGFSWYANGVNNNNMLQTVPFEVLELCQQVYHFVNGIGNVDLEIIEMMIHDTEQEKAQCEHLLTEWQNQTNTNHQQQGESEKQNSACNIF